MKRGALKVSFFTTNSMKSSMWSNNNGLQQNFYVDPSYYSIFPLCPVFEKFPGFASDGSQASPLVDTLVCIPDTSTKDVTVEVTVLLATSPVLLLVAAGIVILVLYLRRRRAASYNGRSNNKHLF